MVELPLLRLVNGYVCLWLDELRLARQLIDPVAQSAVAQPTPDAKSGEGAAVAPAASAQAGVDVSV